ncbi:MAG: M50 family metallopeptidase, partial [Coriobacteriia bacterium]|nr:M50 family metallopeptidase [Coriobacteriia bacterium]
MPMILDAASTVFWGVLTFSILIVLHEGGHFVAARMFGVKVHEFMIGLPGPALRLHTRGGTVFGITAVPLGGYVRIAGMEPGAEDELLAPALATVVHEGRADAASIARELGVEQERASALLVTLADWGAIAPDTTDDVSYVPVIDERSETPDELLDRARSVTYRGLSTMKRILVLSAGVLVNLVTAIAVFTFVLSIWGYYEQSLVLSEVMPDSAAASAGLQVGDTLLSLEGETFETWPEFADSIATYDPGSEVTVGWERDGAPRQATVELGRSPAGTAFLGVGPTVTPVDLTVFEAMAESISWIGLVFVAIGNFFNPATFSQSVEGARSVVGISVEVQKAVEAGPLNYAWIVALLSLSLGVMN